MPSIIDERTAYRVITHHLDKNFSEEEKSAGYQTEYKVEKDNRSFLLDIYLGKGCKGLKLPPNSAIEIKSRIVSNTISNLQYVYDIAKLSKLLVIILDEGFSSTKMQPVNSPLVSRKIELLSLKEFIGRGKTESAVFFNFSRGKDVAEKELKSILERAKFAINNGRYSLFLGAGVSTSAGLPGWNELLKKLIDEAKKDTRFHIDSADFDNIERYPYINYSPLIVARYINEYLNNKYTNLVDLADGEDLKKTKQRYLATKIKEILYKKDKNESNLLIKALADMIRTKQPESVITYNYDDLLEERLKEISVPFVTLVEDTRSFEFSVPIYHVHGFVGKDTSKGDNPILNEADYHAEYQESYLWANIEQMHALNRSTCFFVGLSMTDPNLRRLLDISKRMGDDSICHYAFMKKEKLTDCPFAKEKNEENIALYEKMMNNMGVYVIWYDKHDDLPSILRSLFPNKICKA